MPKRANCKEAEIKRCREAGGQSVWNVTRQTCVCHAIKKDAKGKNIQRTDKEGKGKTDKLGNPLWETENYTVSKERKGNN